jgi:hypothetical protein
MIQPTHFAIHVTYTCPLTCAHCCFSSSPERTESLAIDHIMETIQALDTSTIQVVGFTGGEPFLLGKKLNDIVRAASNRGFATRIITSAYFGKHDFIVQRKLTELRDSGLNELTISWDEYHEKFVPFEYVYSVFWAAKRLGLTVAVHMVKGKNSVWTKDKMIVELGIKMPGEEIIESDLNLTGRAEIELAHDALFEGPGVLTPCPYVLTGPTLSAKNKLLACCGVIPEADLLVLDHDFKPENLADRLQDASNNPLLNWIHQYGPHDVLQWISSRHNIAIPNNINGNCEACRILFHTPEIACHIQNAVQERGPSIMNEVAILSELAWIQG